MTGESEARGDSAIGLCVILIKRAKAKPNRVARTLFDWFRFYPKTDGTTLDKELFDIIIKRTFGWEVGFRT